MRKIENIIAEEFYTLMKSEETSVLEKHFSIRDEIIFIGNVSTWNDLKLMYKLWGNTILRYNHKNDLIFSFCGYMTNTTKNRLNAILSYLSEHFFIYDLGGFYQKNFEIYWKTKKGIAKKIDVSKDYRFVLSDENVNIEEV